MEYTISNPWIILGLLSLTVFLIIMIPLLPALAVAALLRRRVDRVLKQNTATIITQYEPPRDLSPAEIGLLYDSICGEKEIRATLFDLAQKKIISFASDKSVSVTNKAAYEALPEYAKIAVRLFDEQTARTDKQSIVETITILDINGQPQQLTFNQPIRQSVYAFTRAVRLSLRSKGISTKNYHVEFWKRVFFGYWLAWTLPWIFISSIGGTFNDIPHAAWSLSAILIGFNFSLIFGIFLFPAYFSVSFLSLKLFVKIAGPVWLNTKQVRQLWPELEGYRRFLKTVDVPRLQSTDSASSSSTIDTLPYAIVFNLDAKWQERSLG